MTGALEHLGGDGDYKKRGKMDPDTEPGYGCATCGGRGYVQTGGGTAMPDGWMFIYSTPTPCPACSVDTDQFARDRSVGEAIDWVLTEHHETLRRLGEEGWEQ